MQKINASSLLSQICFRSVGVFALVVFAAFQILFLHSVKSAEFLISVPGFSLQLFFCFLPLFCWLFFEINKVMTFSISSFSLLRVRFHLFLGLCFVFFVGVLVFLYWQGSIFLQAQRGAGLLETLLVLKPMGRALFFALFSVSLFLAFNRLRRVFFDAGLILSQKSNRLIEFFSLGLYGILILVAGMIFL